MENDDIYRLGVMAAYFQKYPKVFEDVKQIPKVIEWDTLCRISQNPVLFKAYNSEASNKFGNISDAFDFAKGQGIVVCFMELNLYAVFTSTETYHAMCKFVNDKIANAADDGKEMKVSICQLVLPEQPQRLVFASSTSFTEAIRGYVSIYLKSTISVNEANGRSEITITNPITAGAHEANEIYKRLHTYICEQNRIIAQSIHPININQHGKYEYAETLIDNTIGVSSHADILTLLKTYPGATIILNNGHITNFNNMGNNCNPVIKQQKISAKDAAPRYSRARGETAIAWIESNPPRFHEITTDYHGRYKLHVFGALPILFFSPLVEQCGHVKSHNTQNHYWIPK
jgi:hypothetical protein